MYQRTGREESPTPNKTEEGTTMTEYQREKRREYMRAYSQRPEQKAKRAAYMREYNQRPEQKAKIAAYMREYDKRPEVKARKAEYMKNRYEQDADFRQKVLERSKRHSEQKSKAARIAKAVALLQAEGYTVTKGAE